MESSLPTNDNMKKLSVLIEKRIKLENYFEKQKISSIKSLSLFIGGCLLILLALTLRHIAVIYVSFLVTGIGGLFVAIFFSIKALYFGYKVHQWKL